MAGTVAMEALNLIGYNISKKIPPMAGQFNRYL